MEQGYLDSDVAVPVDEIDMELLLKLLEQQRDRMFSIFQTKDSSKNVSCGFVEVVSALFDLHADILLAVNNIEHNAGLLRPLASVYFPLKDQYYEQMTDMLTFYMENNEIRNLTYPRIHANSITDTLTWWACISMPREVTREIAIDLIARAYLTQYR